MRFRKKPVVIEAMQWTGTASAATPIIDWALAAGGTIRYCEGIKCDFNGAPRWHGSTVEHLSVVTLEGTMRAEIGDWIIKGVADEFYPCRSDIFQATYEPVAEPQPSPADTTAAGAP